VSAPAVVTIAAGRAEHLARQRAGLAGGTLRPSAHVVVSMGDNALSASLAGTGVEVVTVPGGERLPLAAARNAGAARAREHADRLVFLDVDVIPGARLLERYASALQAHPGSLLSGPVAYLPAGVVTDLEAFPAHPARPVPADGTVAPADDPGLFWSLSFALSADSWAATGGFDEAYRGYGAEDTDFALRAERAGVPLAWVGGAVGYHQHHPVSRPPVEHLVDILTNGELFAQRWGWWPMGGWLEAFEERGLVRRDGAGWVAV
jgi:GT2 family glycosyltransferase